MLIFVKWIKIFILLLRICRKNNKFIKCLKSKIFIYIQANTNITIVNSGKKTTRY